MTCPNQKPLDKPTGCAKIVPELLLVRISSSLFERLRVLHDTKAFLYCFHINPFNRVALHEGDSRGRTSLSTACVHRRINTTRQIMPLVLTGFPRKL